MEPIKFPSSDTRCVSGLPVQSIFLKWKRAGEEGDTNRERFFAEGMIAALEPQIQGKAGRYSLGSAADGDDLAQIGRITVLQALSTYDPDAPRAAAFVIYALTAVENAMRDEARKETQRRQQTSPLLYEPLTAGSDWPDSSERRMALDQYLSHLPERECTVITMRYLHGYTQQEIADELSISQPRVAQIEQQALAALRETIGEDGPSLLL